MSTSDPQSTSPAGGTSPSEAVRGAPATTSIGAAVIVASILTILGWLAVDRGYGRIPWPAMSPEYLEEAAAKYADLSTLSDEAKAEYNSKEQKFLHRNSGLVIGLFGLLAGILFGGVAGRERTGARLGLKSALVGGGIGGVFGVVGGYAGATVARIAAGFATEPTSPAEMSRVWLREMYWSIAIHATEWCMVGVGLAIVVVVFGRPSRTLGRSIGMAIGAGLIAGALFTPLASLVAPKVPAGLTVPADPAARGIGAITISAHELSLARLLFVLLPATSLCLMVLAQRDKPPAADKAEEAAG